MIEEKNYCTYIMTNERHTVLYVGITSNLQKRIWEHKNNVYPKSFTSQYRTYKLVYFNCGPDINEAIYEEKRIKGGSRKKKIELINNFNPAWKDLSPDIGL